MKRRFLRPTPTGMRIGGESVPRELARITYRCAECLGILRYRNAGLACKADPNHRFFIHRRDVPAVEALRQAEVSEMAANYEIVDGVLKPREDVLCQSKA